MSHRRIILLFLAFLTTLAGSTYYLLSSTGAATAIVEEFIGKSINRHLFELDKAEIDLAAGMVTIHDFRLASPGTSEPGTALLSIRKAEIELDTDSLDQIGTLRRVDLHQLELNLSITEDGAPDFSQIFRQTRISRPDDWKATPATITVTDSAVRLQIAPDRPSVLFEQFNLTIQQLDHEPGSIQMAGSMRSPMGHEINIEGGGNLRTKSFRTLLSVSGVPITAEQAAAFPEEARQFLDTAKVRGHVATARAWVEYEHNSKTTPIRGGMAIEVHDLDMALPRFPYPITNATGKVFAESNDGGKIHFELQHQSAAGNVNVRGEIRRPLESDRHVDLHVSLDAILVGPSLLASIDQGTLTSLKRVKAAFDPSGGRINGKIQLSSKSVGSRFQTIANLDFEGINARFLGFTNSKGQRRGFPHPMHDAAGRVRIEGDSISFRDLTARDDKGATIHAQGQVTHLRATRPRIKIDISGRGFTFSEQLKEALSHTINNGAAIYDTYSPRGKTDAEVQLRDEGKGLEYSFRLLPQSAEITYSRFPLPFRDVTGSLAVTNEFTRIDLRGRHGGAHITAAGRFRHQSSEPDTGLRSKMWIKATGLTFDTNVYKAARHFKTAIGDFWHDLSPSGKFDAELTMWRKPGIEEFSYEGQLHPLDATVKFTGYPMPIEKLTGSLFFHGKGPACRCDISPIRAEIRNGDGQPPARLLVQGTLQDIGANLTADVTGDVQRLQLTDRLGEALEGAAIVSKDLWSKLKLNGFVDVKARFGRKAGQSDTSQHFEIRLRDVSSTASLLPGKAQGLHGEIIVDDGKADFAVEGMMAWTRIDKTKMTILGGEIHRDGNQTSVNFTISADDFPIDEQIAKSLSGPIRQAYLNRRMHGRARLDNVRVKLRIPDEGTSFQSEFEGIIEARDIYMDVGLPGGQSVEHLTGTVRISKGIVDASGGRMSGQLDDARFELSNHQIHGINTGFEISPSKLTLRNLTFQTAGGTIRGGSSADSRSFEYQFTDRGRIYAYLNYQNLRLRELLKNEALAHSKVRGICNGKVIIHQLDGGDFLDMRASGDIGVHDGRLGTVPLFSAIYKHIKEDNRPQFTKGRVEFLVKDRKVLFRKFNVRSNLIKVEGEGSLDMDGYMDIDLNVPRLFGSAANILILPPLLNEVFAKIVRFKVYGYIRDPKIDHLMPFSPGFARQSLAPIPPVPVASGSRRSYK